MNGDPTERDDSVGTSEYVPAPGFGETGPPSAPSAKSIVPSTVAIPPTHFSSDVTSVPGTAPNNSTDFAVPVVVGRGASNSNGPIMAVLAVALLVIIGGAALLVTTNVGSFGRDDGAASGQEAEAPAASIEPAETTSPLAPSTDDAVPVTVRSESATPETVAPGATAPETAPVPESTTPSIPTPPPSPVAAIDPATGRGFGDLGLAQPVLAEPCTGTYVTFVVGIAGGNSPSREQVQRGLDTFPGSNYVWGGMCPSLRQFNENGDEIYGVVYGPFGSAQEACEIARQFASEGAYVRRLDATDPVGRDDHCA